MKCFVLLFITFKSITLYAQYPGGIALANTRAWFHASAGVVGTSTNVTGWTNQIASMPVTTLNSVFQLTNMGNATQVLDAARFNYQNAINLATNRYFDNGVDLNETQLFGNTTNGSCFIVTVNDDCSFSYCQVGGSGSCGSSRCRNGYGNSIGIIAANTVGWNGIKYNASSNLYSLNFNSATPLLQGYRNGTLNSTTTVTPLTSITNYRFLIGNFPGFTLNESLSELVVFNCLLTATEVNRVETYLGIKYGITLAHNYVNTANTVIYAPTGGYTNHIIGIGRDDNTSLYQRQSHTKDDTVRIYRNTIAASNAANTATLSNLSSLVIGANTGKMCATAASNAEKPLLCLTTSRIEREWKVTNSGFGNPFNMDIKLNSCANLANVTASQLQLLVDDDGNFSNGGTTCFFNGDGTGITISYVNPLVTISGINNTHLPQNATRYITLGSLSTITPLPIEMLDFNITCLDKLSHLEWKTASETNNAYFEIERSKDYINWEVIYKTPGVGNSTLTKTYAYTDKTIEGGVFYYRLKQTDYDGISVYYDKPVYAEDCNPVSQPVVIYPSPSSGDIYFEASEAILGFEMYNCLGQLYREYSKLAGGLTEVYGLPAGIYYIKFYKKHNTQFVQKVVVL